MHTNFFRKTTRAVALTAAVAVLAAPALVTSGSSAASSDPKYRRVSAPNVFYPVRGSKSVKDLKNFSRYHRGTDIKAPCHTPVYATHPGTAEVKTSSRWYSKYAVRVVSGRGGLGTTAAYLTRPEVADGQIIQAGQVIGYTGRRTRSTSCGIYFAVAHNSKVVNPSSWLHSYVGRRPPVTRLFDNAGFTVASFNILGASHTASGARGYATYPSRMVRAVSLMNQRGLDVVGTQEFQGKQWEYFLSKGHGKDWGAYFWDPAGSRRDTENMIIWRKSTMEFVSGETFDIPYFRGNIRHVPAVLLREKATGRTAYFLNVHNPANSFGNAAKYRAQAVAIEKQKVIDLRATGRPVFLLGDFNATRDAFCPLTANKLSISPNSVPSMGCAFPREFTIDWIFAAGQTRFSFYHRDKYPKNAKISDHPLVYAQAHLQD
jgi:endonuclease/exonuclease/phosphatase family metal-dependent hydrolase